MIVEIWCSSWVVLRKSSIVSSFGYVALEVRRFRVVSRQLSADEIRSHVVECAFKSRYRAREAKGVMPSRLPSHTGAEARVKRSIEVPSVRARRGTPRVRARAVSPKGILACFRLRPRFEINDLAGRFRVTATFPPPIKSTT